MTETSEAFRSPYTSTPGGSTPGPGVTPHEGKSELWGFFWLTFVNTAIIAVAGFAAWYWVAH